MIENLCILLVNETMTNNEAVIGCPHGFIFEPENIEMESKINSIIPLKTEYWLGLTYQYDPYNEEVLRYISSAEPVNYTNFHPGILPKFDPYYYGEDCVIMSHKNGTWAWLPKKCDPTNFYQVVCVTEKIEITSK